MNEPTQTRDELTDKELVQRFTSDPSSLNIEQLQRLQKVGRERLAGPQGQRPVVMKDLWGDFADQVLDAMVMIAGKLHKRIGNVEKRSVEQLKSGIVYCGVWTEGRTYEVGDIATRRQHVGCESTDDRTTRDRRPRVSRVAIGRQERQGRQRSPRPRKAPGQTRTATHRIGACRGDATMTRDQALLKVTAILTAHITQNIDDTALRLLAEGHSAEEVADVLGRYWDEVGFPALRDEVTRLVAWMELELPDA